jgi:hypothetical protein
LAELAPAALLLLLCAELAINYVVPSYYLYGASPSVSRTAYNGAPYVEFLRKRNTDHSRIFARESLLYPNWSAAFGLADVRALDAIYDRRYIDFIRNFLLPPGDTRRHGDLADRFTGAEFSYDFSSELEQRFLALSSIRYLVSLSDYKIPAEPIYDRDAKVYEIVRTLPRASLFPTVDVLPDSEVLARLREPDFRFDERVVLSRETISLLDPEAWRNLVAPKSSSAKPARITRYESQRVVIAADTTEPSFLMLTDTNYPGWDAYLNGRKTPVITANYLFRGIIVPPGQNVVEFVYQPASVRIGGAISGAAFALLCVLAFGRRLRRVRRFAASSRAH